MNEPIPTPFDITDIPYIAWEPGPLSWIVLVSAFLLFAVGIGAAALVARRRSPERALAGLLRQLADTRVHSPGLDCERFSRLCRRILSYLVELDLSGCTAQELRNLANASEDSRESEMLTIIATIEECAYAPAGVPEAQALPDLSHRAREALSAFARDRRRR